MLHQTNLRLKKLEAALASVGTKQIEVDDKVMAAARKKLENGLVFHGGRVCVCGARVGVCGARVGVCARC